jgi:4-amino-4-deoxy-L-arabinose transferase-like glycosyltransferase
MKKIALAILIFLFAISLRLWNLNTLGRTWDEQSIVEKGYNFVQLASKGDFSNPYWYDNPDHPPLSNYLYGIASIKDFIKYDKNLAPSYPYAKGMAIFQYDLTYSRLVSVLFSSLAVFLVFIFGVRYFSTFIGFTAATILALLPHFLGYSQLVDHESIITFFFTATVFAYLLFFEKQTLRWIILSGILTGISLEIKQSNILLFVLLIALFLISKKYFSKTKRIPVKKIILVCGIAALTYFTLWPMPFLNFSSFINFTYKMWFQNGGKIPTVLFGHHMGAPIFFYLIAFLITTPTIILLLVALGIFTSYKTKNWIYLVILTWFITPFLLSVFHERQQMVRYIIEFYAPLSLLAAIGLDYILQKVKATTTTKTFAYLGILIYLLIIAIQISPFYFDYYNELVGGTANVYKHHIFFLGEWGQGLRAPGLYLATHVAKHSTIGMALNPTHTLYQSPNLIYKLYNSHDTYDYVVVNYYDEIRVSFDKNTLNKKYKLIYSETKSGVDFADIYKRK